MQLTLPLFEHPDEPRVDVPPAPRPVRSPAPQPEEPGGRIDFVRTPRARRYILRIRPDGSLRVTVPRRGSKREARDFVLRQHRWIARQRERLRQERPCGAWQDGSDIWLRGERVRLTVESRPEGVTIRYGERRVEARTVDEIRAAIELDLWRLAAHEIEPRLRELAAAHALCPGRVSIRNQRSRWGSCARAGNIALNFRLVQMPADVRDYVLVHELMHLRQQNHSPRFWRLVEQACPTFRKAEAWLRSEGKGLF